MPSVRLWLFSPLLIGCAHSAPPAPSVESRARPAAVAQQPEPDAPAPVTAGRKGFRRTAQGILVPSEFLGPHRAALPLLALASVCAVNEHIRADQFKQVTHYYVASLALTGTQLEERFRTTGQELGFEIGFMEEGGLSASGPGLAGNLLERDASLTHPESASDQVDTHVRRLAQSVDFGAQATLAQELPAQATFVIWSLRHDGRESFSVTFAPAVTAPPTWLAAAADQTAAWQAEISEEPLQLSLSRPAFGPQLGSCLGTTSAR